MIYSNNGNIPLIELCIRKGEYGIGASSVPKNINLPTYLRITDITDNGDLITEGLTSVDHIDSSKYYLEENDIVFARTGASTGRAFFYEKKYGRLVYAGFLIKFSLDEKKVNPKYMKYYTLSEQYKGWVKAYTGGSTRGNINAKTFGDMIVELPPRNQQDFLVKNLSSIDDKIELNNKINKNLEELAQTLYKRWFVDFEFPNENGEPYKSSGGEMVESELGTIPKGWTVVKILGLVNKRNEKTRPSSDLKLIDMANMPSYSIALNQFDKGDKLSTNTFKMEKMSFLYGSIRPYLGKFGIAPFDGITTGTIHNFTIRQFDDYSYVASAIFSKEFNEFCIKLSHGTKMPVINWNNFVSYKIVYNKDTVIKFNNLIFPYFEKIILNVNENANLAETRDLLLPKLMSGEIEVPVKE